MNILELCLSPDLGGLELYVYRSGLKLSETDEVYYALLTGGQLAKRVQDNKNTISYFKKSFKLFPVFNALKLARLIDANNIDVIHVHWGRDLSLASFSKWFSKKKPRLIYTRQMQITRNKDDFYHRFIYSQIDVFITITKVLAELARSFLSESDKHKVIPLYYGIKEPERILSEKEKKQFRKKVGFSDSNFVVALFGRIEEFKGQHILIDAIARLKNEGEDIKGLIVGHAMNEDYYKHIKNITKEKSIDKNIFFMDFVENPQEWMQACDLVVLTTKEETFGLVLAEAMQAGVPVIGTNSGGVPEIIEHDETGYLFDFPDAENLAMYIKELKNNKNKRLDFAKRGKEKAKSLFDIEKHYTELRKIMSDS